MLLEVGRRSAEGRLSEAAAVSAVLDVSGMIDVSFVHSVGLVCLPDAEARAPEPGTGLDG
ncbi:hypothetical protein SVIO_024060 [Streptomyces violaceusniger]|uniref:Uncharacterized protein n=1 Tax=Streptomyces violaceusniger TaxID=68280 RepID=A0A4D4L1B8_STRVO|nr:hypothetical protein SVIO_024060 [Streptomyces violaceusniger]